MDSDETLWEGMLRGDQEMFLSLYNKYYHTLLFLGLREIKDAQLVKDTIQQLFLYIWEKRQTINVAKNVKSYLVMSFLRKLSVDWRKIERVSTLQIVHSGYSEDYTPTPEEYLIKKDQQNHLHKLLMNYLDELPARQKELITLRFYEGLSYEEIVQQTGLSHRTVYNKIHEALKKLRLDMANNNQNNNTAFLTLMLCLFISYHEMNIQ